MNPGVEIRDTFRIIRDDRLKKSEAITVKFPLQYTDHSGIFREKSVPFDQKAEFFTPITEKRKRKFIILKATEQKLSPEEGGGSSGVFLKKPLKTKDSDKFRAHINLNGLNSFKIRSNIKCGVKR